MVPGKGKAFLEKERAWAEVCRRRNYEASVREHKDHKGVRGEKRLLYPLRFSAGGL